MITILLAVGVKIGPPAERLYEVEPVGVATITPSRTVDSEYITLYCETIAHRYNGEEGRGYVDVFQVWNEVDLILMQAKWGSSAESAGGGSIGRSFDGQKLPQH